MLRLSPLESDKINSISEPIYDKVDDNAGEQQEQKGMSATDEIEVDTYTYYVEIVYSRIEKRPMSLKDFNPEEKFIRRKGKRFELTEAFANYELTGATGQ